MCISFLMKLCLELSTYSSNFIAFVYDSFELQPLPNFCSVLKWKAIIFQFFPVTFCLSKLQHKNNKRGTSQVSAISKAQKAQRFQDMLRTFSFIKTQRNVLKNEKKESHKGSLSCSKNASEVRL